MASAMNRFIDYFKSHLISCIFYCAALAVTLVVVLPLMIWTILGNIENTLAVRDTEIVCDDGVEVQTEYLVNQPFAKEGLYLSVDGERVPLTDCQVNADFTSAGETTVDVLYNKTEFLSYRATVDVNVIFVRSMWIEVYPYSIEISDGKAIADENFKMYAYLASEPETEAFGDVLEHTASGYKVKLDDAMVTQSVKQDAKVTDFYSVDYYCGDLSAGFSFYNAAGRSFVVSSTKDLVSYEETAASSGATMMLVVTDRDSSYQRTCTGVTTGYYIYGNPDGETTAYPFNFELKDKEECLTSEEVTEAFDDDNDAYTVTVDGHEFAADKTLWQSAVVNGMIVDDHGFKLVIGSERRILNFTYTTFETGAVQLVPGDDSSWTGTLKETPVEPSPDDPTLTLYVTDYSLDPKLGTGNGYSYGIYVFTDRNGNSYKIRFYLGAFVWTYVPLSSSVDDKNSEAHVSDLVYTEVDGVPQWSSFHRGNLYATVEVQSRGGGSITEQFVVHGDDWMNPIIGL